MIVIGLTGSIGMGKSTASSLFAFEGAAVHDSDAAVHKLLQAGSEAWPAIKAAFPYFHYPQIYQKSWKFWQSSHAINRKELGKTIFKNDELRLRLESILHPLVKKAQSDFLRVQQHSGREFVVLDIPLLFETRADDYVDYTVVVTAPHFMQHKRVLSRPGMSPEKFSGILQSQMPDGEKRARADYIIHSGLGRAHMMREVKAVLCDIRKKHKERKSAA